MGRRMGKGSTAFSYEEYHTAVKVNRPQLHTTQVGLTNIVVRKVYILYTAIYIRLNMGRIKVHCVEMNF